MCDNGLRGVCTIGVKCYLVTKQRDQHSRSEFPKDHRCKISGKSNDRIAASCSTDTVYICTSSACF